MNRNLIFAFFPPLGFALFPVLFLFSNNINELFLQELWSPLRLAALSAFIAFFLASVFTRERERASVFASMLILAFWYYGFFYEALYPILAGKSVWGQELARHRILLPLWTTLWGVITLVFLKGKPLRLASFVRGGPVFLVVGILLFIPAYTIVIHELSYSGRIGGDNAISISTDTSTLPDIYYIIPDGYANSKVLSQFFGYNNSEFLEYLRLKGFHILSGSTSNYVKTWYSLPSTLNMEYLDQTSKSLKELAGHKKVVQFLRERGYKFVLVASTSSVLKGEEADARFVYNEFQRLLRRMTVLTVLRNPQSRILNTFSNLREVARLQGPKFVVVHVLVPHHPYLFDEDGKYIGINARQSDTPKEMELYLGQLKFANQKLKESIDSILQSSGERTPVIIVQSDHGTRLPEEWVPDEEKRDELRLRNFAAYLLPGKEAVPPDNLSAVNTFRFLFDLYFDTGFGLLENKYWPSGDPFGDSNQ